MFFETFILEKKIKMFVAYYQSIDPYAVRGVCRCKEQSEKRLGCVVREGALSSPGYIALVLAFPFRSPFVPLSLSDVIAWPTRLQHLYWYSDRTLQNT